MDRNILYKALLKAKDKGVTINSFFNSAKDKSNIEEISHNPYFADYLADIKSKARDYKEQPISVLPYSLFKLYDTNGNRIKYEEIYFNRHGRLMTFGLMAWLYENQDDISEIEDILWAICDDYSWALPAHMGGESLSCSEDSRLTIDLFSCETAAALSEIIYLLSDKLSNAVKTRVINEIFKRVLNNYINHNDGEKFPFENMSNNWCAVCAGSIGMCAIYLIVDENILADVLAKLMPTFQSFINSFEDDGACIEGLSYWTYGVSFYVSFCDLLYKRTGSEIDMLSDKKFHKIAKFQQSCYFTGGRTLSFSDGNSHDSFRMGLTSFLADKFDDVALLPISCSGAYNSDNCYRWINGFRDLLWSDFRLTDKATAENNSIFPNAQWMICHSQNGADFAIKGGHNDEPHNHNDVGHFLLFKNGEEMLTDLGGGEYIKDYFSDKRYTIFCNNSFSHSVPIIDGNGQKSGKNHRAENVKFAGSTSASMDIESAYGIEKIKKINRSLKFDENSGQIELIDSFDILKLPESVIERFVTRYKPEITEDFVTIKAIDEACRIYFDKAMFSAKIKSYNHSNHSGINEIVYAIDFNLIKPTDKFVCHFTIK